MYYGPPLGTFIIMKITQNGLKNEEELGFGNII